MIFQPDLSRDLNDPFFKRSTSSKMTNPWQLLPLPPPPLGSIVVKLLPVPVSSQNYVADKKSTRSFLCLMSFCFCLTEFHRNVYGVLLMSFRHDVSLCELDINFWSVWTKIKNCLLTNRVLNSFPVLFLTILISILHFSACAVFVQENWGFNQTSVRFVVSSSKNL